MMRVGVFQILCFILSLPFLWLMWRISPCRWPTFWGDMREIAGGF
jgi:hypothetical protein